MNSEYIKSLFPKQKLYYEDNMFKHQVNLDEIIDKIIAKHNIIVGELEGKIYAYEQIIANSNFKAILSKDKQALEKRIKELEEK
jgi:hypothetical protein